MMFQENYNTPQAIPLANYERNPFIGLGVCSKGVLKQP